MTSPSTSTPTLSLEQRREFWRNYGTMIDLFGGRARPIVDRWLMTLPVSDVAEEYKSPLRGAVGGRRPSAPPGGVSIPLGVQHTAYTYHWNGWERRDYDVPCDVWLVPNRHQGTREAKILKALLEDAAPWLASFPCDVYAIGYGRPEHYEFYVQTGATLASAKSLYVPLQAFLAGDVEAIIQRNERYWRNYYVGPRAQEAEDTIKAIMESPVTQEFLRQVAANRPETPRRPVAELSGHELDAAVAGATPRRPKP